MISPKWVTSGEYNDNLIIKCRKVKKSSSYWVLRENAADLSNSSEIAEDCTSWDIVGEYNDDLFIRCVLASKRNRSKEKGENDHTGLMDKADGSESDNAPAKLDKDTSIEGKGNK